MTFSNFGDLPVRVISRSASRALEVSQNFFAYLLNPVFTSFILVFAVEIGLCYLLSLREAHFYSSGYSKNLSRCKNQMRMS